MMDWNIYAEWLKDGVFGNGFFGTWESFWDYTFSPDYDVTCIKVRKGDKWC